MNVTRKGASNYLTTDLVSHTRKVCSLYKRLLRNIDFSEDDFYEARFQKLQLRAEFDKHKDIKDARVAKALLEKGEKHFEENGHPYYVSGIEIHPYSKDGIAYGRCEESPDYVMDYYHPLDKARYPYYFAKREEMKKEYLNLWKKKMG
uniref:NADH dehydrogenase [ubiquinone] 1 beta subcomplex subunit 9 n=1 Tax=Aceria tosichella TaxID=561515 RepID=A0A6G1S538_9ACAR